MEDCKIKFEYAVKAYLSHLKGVVDDEKIVLDTLRVEVLTVDNVFKCDVFFSDCPCEECERGTGCGTTTICKPNMMEVQINAKYMIFADPTQEKGESDTPPPSTTTMDLPTSSTRPLLATVPKGQNVIRNNPPVASSKTNGLIYKAPEEMHLGVQSIRFRQLLTTYENDRTWVAYKDAVVCQVKTNMAYRAKLRQQRQVGGGDKKYDDDEVYYGCGVYKYLPQTVSSSTEVPHMSSEPPFSFNPHIKKIRSYEEADLHVEMLIRTFQSYLGERMSKQKAALLKEAKTKEDARKIGDREAHVFFELSYLMIYDFPKEAKLESCSCSQCSR